MIRLQNINVSFGLAEVVHALQQMELVVNKGEWISILGPSGSGKTTLLNVIAGTQSVTKGTVIVDTKDVHSLIEQEKQAFRRNTIGFIYQHYRLFNQFSVLENVMLPQWPYQNRKQLKETAASLLEKVGMSHRLIHLPEQLSGGEKQRVAIARALLNNPEILLCDEPTGNLDTENRIQVLKLFKELNEEGKTIIVVTHDQEVAKESERKLFLRDGMVDEELTG